MNATPSSPLPAADPRREAPLVTRLLRAVIAKSFLDLIFICAAVSLAAFLSFHPLLRGAIDVADQTRVAGWAYDPLSPDEKLEVQLFIDGRFAASTRAGERREDLVRAGAAANPEHGFSFAVAPLRLTPGAHAAQVYAVHQAAGRYKTLLPLAAKPLMLHIP
jgi:hypothetical protein